MRNPIGFLALSLLAAAFAGCSSTETGKTSSTYNPDLPGALAKYNAALVPLAHGCAATSTAGTAVICQLAPSEIIVLSLRSADTALLANGNPITYTDTKGATALVTSKVMTSLTVEGVLDSSTPPVPGGLANSPETVIIDIRNGIFAAGKLTVDLMGNGTQNATVGDEVAVLGTTAADKMTCLQATTTVNSVTTVTGENIDLNGDGTADIKPTLPQSGVANHYTIDLNSGDDTFDQKACTTTLSVYGSAGKDTITVGTSALSLKDTFSGGTDGTTAAESVDTITFEKRTSAGVTVKLDGTANDGDGNGLVEQDNIANDFEVVTGTAKNDILIAGQLVVGTAASPKPSSYTLNAGDGNDFMAGYENFGVTLNGGLGVDTVDYHSRALPVVVTMDGKTADDGEKSATCSSDGTANGTVWTGCTSDNVGADVENIIGTDVVTGNSAVDDKITGNLLNNVFKAGAGNDVVVGGDGDDVFVAGKADGSDAADGDDIFQGGLGNDTVDYSTRLATVVTVNLDATFSAATVAGTKSTGTASGTTSGSEADYYGPDVENVVGTIGADVINGSALPNSVWGMGAADKLIGGAGSDSLDNNVYTGILVTPKGYSCKVNVGNTSCYPAGGGTVLSPTPADCDCTAAGGTVCATGTCTASGGATLADTAMVTTVCNPYTNAAVTSVWTAASSVAGGTCSGALTVSNAACAGHFECGGDSMDIATCKAGVVDSASSDAATFEGTANNFYKCWKTQT